MSTKRYELDFGSFSNSQRRLENGRVSGCVLGTGNHIFVPVYYNGDIGRGGSKMSFWRSDVYNSTVYNFFTEDQDVSHLFVIYAEFKCGRVNKIVVPCGFFTVEEVQLWRNTVSNKIIEVRSASLPPRLDGGRY